MSTTESGQRDGHAMPPRWGRWRFVAVLGMVAAAGALAVGCGGSDDGDAGSSEASADSDPAVAYAECMRENGVPEFPDPVDGQTQLQAGPESGIDPNSPEFQQAQEACQDLAPQGADSGGAPPEEVQRQALAFAQCMRDNGMPDFPDPQFSAGGVIMGGPGSGIDPNSPEFEAAMQACRDKVPSGLGGSAP